MPPRYVIESWLSSVPTAMTTTHVLVILVRNRDVKGSSGLGSDTGLVVRIRIWLFGCGSGYSDTGLG